MTKKGSRVSRVHVEFSNGDTYTIEIKDNQIIPNTSPCMYSAPPDEISEEEILYFCTMGRMHTIKYDEVKKEKK